MPNLDPWMTIQLPSGNHLFGFVDTHRRLGGKSWIITSPIVELDADKAVTLSHTVYCLGKRIAEAELPTDESRIALQLLLDRETGKAVDALLVEWLVSCKMGRWLNREIPDRQNPHDVRWFIITNFNAYMKVRGVYT